MKKKCSNCGYEYSDGDIFCFECGQKIENNLNEKEDLKNEIDIEDNTPEKFEKKNKPKKLIMIISALFFIVFIVVCGFYYSYIEKCKYPYGTTYTFADTANHIYARYNSKYKVININLTVDQIVESWQIDENGSNTTNITITCKANDNSVERDFTFKDIILRQGEKIQGTYTINNADLKDFVDIKNLLASDSVTISYSTIFDMDSKERAILKNKYYQRQKELKEAEDRLNAIQNMAGLMMFDGMFGY